MQISALRSHLSSALLDFAWDEWAQMGILAAAGRSRRWTQDPEALLLLTFEIARDDPRLFDEILDWLVRNEPLISVRRLRMLCDGPQDERLSAAVLEWVKRQRRPHAPVRELESMEEEAEALFRTADLPAPRADPAFGAFGFTRPVAQPSGKSREPDYAAPINLAFRLRQLLGVGARAEAVRYLLTAATEPVTVADIAGSAGYSKRNVQEALSSLHAAGVAKVVSGGGEQRFAVDRSRWAHLLDLEPHELPVYRDWPRLLGALRRIVRWLARPELHAESDYLRASQAADLLDAVRPELSKAGVIMPAKLGGERSWTDLEDTVEYALLWLTSGSGTSGRPAAFEIVPHVSEGQWWRLTTAAGRIVAMSTESFATERDAERAARDARDLIAGAAPPRVPSKSLRRARRHVTLRPDGLWQVRAEGATKAASTHATKADAVKSAKHQALKAPGGGEVVVHGRDGRIRSSHVMPPGK